MCFVSPLVLSVRLYGNGFISLQRATLPNAGVCSVLWFSLSSWKSSEYSWVLFYFVFKPSLIWHRRAEKREIKTCDLIWVHSAGWQITVSYSVMFKPIFRSTFYLCSMSLRPTTIWFYIRDCTNPKNSMSDLSNWSVLEILHFLILFF